MAEKLDTITTSERGASRVTSSDFMTNFNRHPETDQLVRLTNSEAVKRSVRNLILTKRGERMFQPSVGSDIDRILFEPMTEQTTIVLEQFIREVIKKYEPRVIDLQVYVQADDFNNSYAVSIVFNIINNSNPIAINLNLSRVR